MAYCNVDDRSSTKSLASVIRWKLGLHHEQQSPNRDNDGPASFAHNDGFALRHAATDSLTWIGHASFLLQLGGRSALIDPVMSERLASYIHRKVPPGLSWSAMPKIDVVLVTHNHRDHMDAPTLRRLGKQIVYVVPDGLGDWFRRRGMCRIVEMRWWQREEIEGLKITFVPAQHWSRRGAFDINRTLWGGYVIERGGVRVYHSGDTAWFEGFTNIASHCGEIDLAMLPIGAYAPRWFMRSQHMDPIESVRAYTTLRAKRFCAMHWGTFKLTDEDLSEPPKLLRAAWEQQALSEPSLFIPAVGETLMF